MLSKVTILTWQSWGVNPGSLSPLALGSWRLSLPFTAPWTSLHSAGVAHRAKWQLAERVPLPQQPTGSATQP